LSEYSPDQALLDAAYGSGNVPDGVLQQTQSAPDTAIQPGPGQIPPTTPQETFSQNVDPNQLAPELQTVYRNMQADYTRKMQDIAAYRSLGELAELQRMQQFVQALATDADAQREVYEKLGQHLGVGTAPPQATPEFDDDFDFDGDNKAVNELQRKLQELESWKVQQEQQSQYNFYVNMFNAQESQIRTANPHYKDSDVQRIYQLAHAYDADLLQAEEAYKQWKQDIVSDYLNTKGSVNAGPSPLPTGPGQEPTTISTFDQADAAALSRLRAEGFN
jgi:hypothetical protein